MARVLTCMLILAALATPAGVPAAGAAEEVALVKAWGPFRQDDLNVAAAGEFQAAATRLADRAGYK